MHSPVEVVNLGNIENTVKLIVAALESLSKPALI